MIEKGQKKDFFKIILLINTNGTNFRGEIIRNFLYHLVKESEVCILVSHL
jgi:hypothetical protein